jgi:hypothetical protein
VEIISIKTGLTLNERKVIAQKYSNSQKITQISAIILIR